VYVIDEGRSLRILPEAKEANKVPLIDASRIVDESLIPTLLHCLYVSNVDEAIIRVRDSSSVILDMKRKSSEFIGLEAYEEGRELIRVKVLMDSERIDIGSIIRLIGHNSAKGIEVLKEVLSEGPGERAEREVQVLKRDFVRYQHAIIRYLMVKYPLSGGGLETYQTALITSYLGYINDIILEVIERILSEDLKVKGERVAGVLDTLRDLVISVVHNVTSPSLKRLGPLCAQIGLYDSMLENMMRESESKDEVIVLSRLQDVARVLCIITRVLLCKALLSKAEWVSEPETK
jgi:hypothetical protein